MTSHASKVRAGVKRRQARGLPHGAPRVLTDAQELAALELWYEGATLAAIADQFGVSERTVGRALARGRGALPRPALQIDCCTAVEVFLAFLEGASMGRLAQRFHVPRTTVEQAIRQEIVRRRARGDRP